MKNWCSYTHQLLRELNLGEHWRDVQTVKDEGAWRKLVSEEVARREQKRWRTEVENNKVLEVYAQLKKNLGWESYLDGTRTRRGGWGWRG